MCILAHESKKNPTKKQRHHTTFTCYTLCCSHSFLLGWLWQFWPTSSILGSTTHWVTLQPNGDVMCFVSAQEWPFLTCCSNLFPASLSIKCTANEEESTTLTLVRVARCIKYVCRLLNWLLSSNINSNAYTMQEIKEDLKASNKECSYRENWFCHLGSLILESSFLNSILTDITISLHNILHLTNVQAWFKYLYLNFSIWKIWGFLTRINLSSNCKSNWSCAWVQGALLDRLCVVLFCFSWKFCQVQYKLGETVLNHWQMIPPSH